jgi:hypothetical protein
MPLGYETFRAGGQLVLDPQRRKHIDEFLRSMTSYSFIKPGVLFSGPHRVGQSSICFSTFLVYYVRNFIMTYIPRAEIWVQSSSTQNQARAYFMKNIFDISINCDLIISRDDVYPFFQEQFNGL